MRPTLALAACALAFPALVAAGTFDFPSIQDQTDAGKRERNIFDERCHPVLRNSISKEEDSEPLPYYSDKSVKCASWHASGLCVPEDYCPLKRRRCRKAMNKCERTCRCGPTAPPAPRVESCQCDVHRQGSTIRTKEVCAKYESGVGTVCIPADHSHPGDAGSCASDFTLREQSRGSIMCIPDGGCVPPHCAGCRSIALPCAPGAREPYKLLNYSSIKYAFDRLLASPLYDAEKGEIVSNKLEKLEVLADNGEELSYAVDDSNPPKTAIEQFRNAQSGMFLGNPFPGYRNGINTEPDYVPKQEPSLPFQTHPPLTCAPRPAVTPGGESYCATHVHYYARTPQNEMIMNVLGAAQLREIFENRIRARRKLQYGYIGFDSFMPDTLSHPAVLQFLRSIAGLLFIEPATEVQCSAAAGDPYPAIGLSELVNSPYFGPGGQRAGIVDRNPARRRQATEEDTHSAAKNQAGPKPAAKNQAGPKPVEDKADVPGRRLESIKYDYFPKEEIVDAIGEVQVPTINAPMPQCFPDSMVVGTYGLDPIDFFAATIGTVAAMVVTSIDAVKEEAFNGDPMVNGDLGRSLESQP